MKKYEIKKPGEYLFLKYPRQSKAQDIMLYLEGREQRARWREDPEIGGGSLESEWNGRDLSFVISSDYLPEVEADQFLDDNRELIENILESYEEEWDGNNHKGNWDDDLVAELREIIEKFRPTIEEPDYLPGEVARYYGYDQEEEQEE